MFVFLDESGDLGFDFTKKGTSRYFVITILSCQHPSAVREIGMAIKKTIKHKVNFGKKKMLPELKGTQTPIEAKKYLYKKLEKVDGWRVFSVVVDKKTFKTPKYIESKGLLYNWIAGALIKKIPLKKGDAYVVIDKSKTEKEIFGFNRFIEGIVFDRTNGGANLLISHEDSQKEKVLQAVDLFCHGIYKKHESAEVEWYELFKDKIEIELLL